MLPLMLAVVLYTALTELVPAARGRCIAALFAATGNLPVTLSIAVAAAALAGL